MNCELSLQERLANVFQAVDQGPALPGIQSALDPFHAGFSLVCHCLIAQ